MKKLFSLFAVVLMASSMMAQFDTWSVVGSKAIMNGTADWAISETANDMATEDGVTYTLTVTGKTLEVGTTYEYKYAKGHAWTVSVPQNGNLSLTVAETAVYDIVYTVNVSDKTHSAVATKAGEAGEISHVYSIAGSSAVLFGAAWNQTATATEMVKGEDGIYSWTREGVELAAATIEYKVVVDHAWGEAYPAQNAKLVIAEAATYNVVVTFNPADKAVNATANKVGGEPGPGPEPEPEAENVTFTVTVPEGTKACYIAGNFNGWSFAEMTAGEGVYTYTTEDKFLADTLEYKYLSGAGWDYREVTAEGNDITNRSYQANDVVAAWKETYDPEAPVAPQDTIYFVNTLGWEKVYIHAWGGTGVSTEWSSCPELNKVDYQLKGYDVYMFEAIEGYYGRLLFKNASGDVAQGDDVRTADLDWTSGKYYYKGLWMTRAEVEAPDPVLTYDTTMYVAGNFTEWAAGMKTLPYTIALPADSALEFKLVRVVITYADEVEVKRDTVWYGQKNEGNAMTREANAWLLDGGYNVLLTTDVEGDYTFDLVEGIFTVTFPALTYKSITFHPGAAAEGDATFFLYTSKTGGDPADAEVRMMKGENGVWTAQVLDATTHIRVVRCQSGAEQIIWGEGQNVWNDSPWMPYSENLYFARFNKSNGWLMDIVSEEPEPIVRETFTFVPGEMQEEGSADVYVMVSNDEAEIADETIRMTYDAELKTYTADVDNRANKVYLLRVALGATEIVWDGNNSTVYNGTGWYPYAATYYFTNWNEWFFVLSTENPNPTPSAVENGSISTVATKAIQNGNLYILREGKTYNAAGLLVK